MADQAGQGSSSLLSSAFAKLGCTASARGLDREAAICRAVVDLLNETTYESLTMDAVAARAKASKATIYRRWPNKENLVVDALSRLLANDDAEPADTGNLRSDILARIISHSRDSEVVAAKTAALKTLVFAASSDEGLARNVQASMWRSELPAWQIFLDRAYRRGDITRPLDAQVIYDVVQAQFCSRIGVHSQPVDQAYIVQVVDDVLIPVILHAGSKTGPAAQALMNSEFMV